MKKIKANIGAIFVIVVYMAAGAVCGIFSVKLISHAMGGRATSVDRILALAFLLLSIFASMFLHVIIHEGGHYVFGRLSGYRLSSFRIGSFMFIRKDGKVELKRFMIAGTGGQCLMTPPDCSDSSFGFPFLLYNLGGIIANIITSLIGMIIFYVIGGSGFLSVILSVFSIIGIAFAIINGVPMKLGGITNDGYNALYLGKDNEVLKAFWRQLTINGKLAEGIRLKNMPEEWFDHPEGGDMRNPLIHACSIVKGSRYHDQMDFQRAQELYTKLLEDAPGLLEVHKNEMKCELMFYEIIGEGRTEKIDKLYTKSLKKYIKTTSSYISRQRLMYAYELLINKDKLKAQERLKAFEKTCRSYPYSAEIESEREIIEYINHKAEGQRGEKSKE